MLIFAPSSLVSTKADTALLLRPLLNWLQTEGIFKWRELWSLAWPQLLLPSHGPYGPARVRLSPGLLGSWRPMSFHDSWHQPGESTLPRAS